MPARVSVFVTDTLLPRAREILEGFEVFESEASDDALARCEGLICWPRQARRELIGKMESLKMVQTMSAGVDGLDFRSLPLGVQVYSNAGAFTDSVAEHAWGILLGVAKGIQLRAKKTAPRMLRGKTLLVIGGGSIGSEVARLSRSISMRTIGLSRSFRVPEMFDERYPLSELPMKIGEADAVVMALPLTKGTRGLMSYSMLLKSKPGVIVVNVGRGESVSEEGLVRWLKERPESRYATDVFWVKKGRESFDTPAWELLNFAGTLHVSGAPLDDDLSEAKVAATRNVRRYFETGNALNHVDPSEYV